MVMVRFLFFERASYLYPEKRITLMIYLLDILIQTVHPIITLLFGTGVVSIMIIGALIKKALKG